MNDNDKRERKKEERNSYTRKILKDKRERKGMIKKE